MQNYQFASNRETAWEGERGRERERGGKKREIERERERERERDRATEVAEHVTFYSERKHSIVRKHIL